MSVQSILTQLESNDPLPANVELTHLSTILPEDLALLRDRWDAIDVERRRRLVRRLAELAEDNVELEFEEVFKLALEDEDSDVRASAIEGLWECTDRRIIAPLIHLMRTDGAENVRAAAAQLLGRFAYRAEMDELRPRDAERVQNALLEVIDDRDEAIDVRRRAIEAISPLSLERIRAIIEDAYNSDEPSLRASALYAMGRNCDPRWLPVLFRELESPDSEMRFESANACGEIEDRRSVPHLIPLLDDQDVQVQLAAVTALGRIGGTLAKQALRRCLENDREHLNDAARAALTEAAFDEDPMNVSMTD